jgi:hypothetical protein
MAEISPYVDQWVSARFRTETCVREAGLADPASWD